jgi:DNA-binding protein YbaB
VRWGSAYAGEPATDRTPAAPSRDDDLAQRLQDAVSGPMSSDDVRTAVLELLAMAEDVERGLDEVSARLPQSLAAQHTGRSPDRRVMVTVTGGGEVVEVGYELRWLRDAHEINIGRLTMAAFTAAYAAADISGVDRLIAGSGLGAVLRQTQDPFGLARRLRLRD